MDMSIYTHGYTTQPPTKKWHNAICSNVDRLRWLKGKESACNGGDAGDASLIPEWGRCPRGGNGNPFQHSCQEHLMDRGAPGVTKSRTRLGNWTHSTQPSRKKDVIMPFAITWHERLRVDHTKWSQTENDNYPMRSLTCVIWNMIWINLFANPKQTHTQKKNNSWSLQGKGWGSDKWGVWD